MTESPDLTLVCGGGGVWGIAWMTGLAMGLADVGVDLRDATTIMGRDYVDGGTWRTAENAHLAEGADAVLILAPMANIRAGDDRPLPGLAADVARLEAQGTAVVVIGADEGVPEHDGHRPARPCHARAGGRARSKRTGLGRGSAGAERHGMDARTTPRPGRRGPTAGASPRGS